MIRRQLINLSSRSIDYRVGFGALDELSRMLSSAVGRPKRALLVFVPSALASHGETVRRSLSDAGFAFEELTLAEGERATTLAAASQLFDALDAANITCDDLLVALGGRDVCSLVSWASRQWCGRTECVLVPTTFDAMVCCATTMDPIETGTGAPLISLRPEPGVVCCDLDLVRAVDPAQLKPGYVELVRSMMVSSRVRWNQFGEYIPEILEGGEVALINALQWSQTARRDVLTATNPSSRMALTFGASCARALRLCLGKDIPAWQLIAEGMRFEARMAVDIADFDVEDVFELDDRLDDLGIEELAFDIEPARFSEAFRTEHARRSNRQMLALPAAPGAVRLHVVEDDVFERHAQAYLASRAELL